MNTTFLKYFLLLFLVSSCNKKTADLKALYPETESIIGKDSLELVKVYKCEFVTNPQYENETYFVYKFELRNNTNNAINYFRFGYEINATFENQQTLWRGGENSTKQRCRIDNEITGDVIKNGIYEVSSPKINFESLWKPNENKIFYISLPDIRQNIEPFSKESFERTPASVTLNLKFHSESIDGEVEEIHTVDLMEQWKNYQKKLGYRK